MIDSCAPQPSGKKKCENAKHRGGGTCYGVKDGGVPLSFVLRLFPSSTPPILLHRSVVSRDHNQFLSRYGTRLAFWCRALYQLSSRTTQRAYHACRQGRALGKFRHFSSARAPPSKSPPSATAKQRAWVTISVDDSPSQPITTNQ